MPKSNWGGVILLLSWLVIFIVVGCSNDHPEDKKHSRPRYTVHMVDGPSFEAGYWNSSDSGMITFKKANGEMMTVNREDVKAIIWN